MKSLFFIMIFSAGSFALSAQSNARIKSLKFSGNEILPDDVLRAQMNTQSKKSLEKIFFWKKKPEFIPTALEDDVDRLRSYYNRNGFLDPEIGFSIDTLKSGRLVSITVNINENSFVRTGNLGTRTKGDTLTEKLVTIVRPQFPLKEGMRFRDDDVFRSEDMLRKKLSGNGYPYASVSRRIRIVKDSLIADVVFTIDPGKRSYFGSTAVSGDTLVPEKFIRKYILFSEGELYRQGKIDSTQQDLFETDLFRYVVVAPEKDSARNNLIPVEVVLKELPRWSLEAGVGYGTEDKLRLAAQVTRRNFLGGTRKLIVNAKTSYFNPFNIDVRFIQPDFLIPKLDLILNPFYLRDREISYKIDRMGGSARLVYQLSKKANTHFSYSFERDRLLELTDVQANPEELRHNKSVFSLGGEMNSSNDPFYPSKGYKSDGSISFSGLGLSAAVHYYKFEVSLVNYFSLSDDVVLATKIRTGVLQTMGISVRTPIEERFYLGGATSLRGWGRHRISPLNEQGFALGGNTMAEASAELRFPIYNLLHGALFTDLGNVWYEPYRYDFGRLHYNAGAGLRIRTPIGPVRLDLATPVINDGFNLQFFISVGHAF